MRTIYILMIFSFLNGCGGAENADPASQETLDSNSIDQNIPASGGSE